MFHTNIYSRALYIWKCTLKIFHAQSYLLVLGSFKQPVNENVTNENFSLKNLWRIAVSRKLIKIFLFCPYFNEYGNHNISNYLSYKELFPRCFKFCLVSYHYGLSKLFFLLKKLIPRMWILVLLRVISLWIVETGSFLIGHSACLFFFNNTQ